MDNVKRSPVLLAVLAAVIAVVALLVVMLVRTQRQVDTLSRVVAERREATSVVVPVPVPVAVPAGVPAQLPSTNAPQAASPVPTTPPPPTPAIQTTAVATAPPSFVAALDSPDQAPVPPPKMPESKAFVERHQLAPEQWEQLVHVNRNWMRRLDRVERLGETGFGGPPDKIAAEREQKLQSILGTPEAVKDFHEFEKGGSARRVNVTAGGLKLGGSAFE